jgi:hypothetical protein
MKKISSKRYDFIVNSVMSNVKPASRQAGVRREIFFHLYPRPNGIQPGRFSVFTINTDIICLT